MTDDGGLKTESELGRWNSDGRSGTVACDKLGRVECGNGNILDMKENLNICCHISTKIDNMVIKLC